MKYRWSIMLLMVFCPGSNTSVAFNPIDARSQGLASAGIMLADYATGMSNEAALALLKKACFSLHAEDPFLLPELTAGAFSLCVPLRTGTFCFSFSEFGYEAFREGQSGLSFGKAFGEKVRAGIGMNYCFIRQYADYGNLQAFIPAVGLQVNPAQGLTLGFRVSNPACQSFYPHGYMKIPTVVKAGLGYSPGHDILFCIEYTKATNCKPMYCGGMECYCTNRLTFRFGLSSLPSQQYAIGIGIRGDRVRTDLAFSHHPVLGYSPAISITCSF
jgi:hypothetical protein